MHLLRFATCVVLLLPTLAHADRAPASQPAPDPALLEFAEHGVDLADGKTVVQVARIRIADPRVSIHAVPGGDDPDGDGRFDVTMQLPTRLAEQHRFELTINAAFADCKGSRDNPTGRTVYRVGMWADLLGYFVADGRILSDTAWGKNAALVVHDDRRVEISEFARIPRTAREMISGSEVLVWNGRNIARGRGERHPRTLAGIDREGRLVLAVADGRRPGHSIGFTDPESADFMISLGCRVAINLDGGGSSVMIRREDNRYRVLNRPSDGSDLLGGMSIVRPVAVALGVRVAEKDPPMNADERR
jgi:hypothetical protein